MFWELANKDGSFRVDLEAGGNGGLSGKVDLQGNYFYVAGGWSPAPGSVPGRNYSAFSFSGPAAESVIDFDWISASGIMTGSGDSPTRIDIEADTSSSRVRTQLIQIQ